MRTLWFGRRFITDFASGETFRGLDTFRKGPNRMEVIMFSNHCDDRADADGEQVG